MSIDADLTLLGHASRLPQHPEEAKLEAFANKTPHRQYLITLHTREFSSLCPVTGQPDAAELEIVYVPDALCVETKSLKYYLASFRNHAAFNEQIVNGILDDLVALLQPCWLRVSGKFAQRGGIQLSCVAEHQPENRPVFYQAAR